LRSMKALIKRFTSIERFYYILGSGYSTSRGVTVF
jgi:hypothetical protein